MRKRKLKAPRVGSQQLRHETVMQYSRYTTDDDTHSTFWCSRPLRLPRSKSSTPWWLKLDEVHLGLTLAGHVGEVATTRISEKKSIAYLPAHFL
ncbi:hypothetical protein QL093DRAFT_2272296 [Fusarium oxysporum]|nr:hypothetical protein QL093DRAFT_2272296 [Fusarium oxysporum]